MSDTVKCIWCGIRPCVVERACQSCLDVFVRVERVLGHTKAQRAAKGDLAIAVIRNPGGAEEKALEVMEEYAEACATDPAKATMIDAK
ncbi:hypothetical protein [Thiorhodococcus minor]|uniref:Uncharacterized protein n=1 Tax=Thiorhodococcus minor TaxID=57489 RepID=A0A6M0JY76_9GAMM|nr:hypothetical protein [Thiorhodococcus minor]NEV62024.1 hypothetical protein [Thiorhodococcus minor]